MLKLAVENKRIITYIPLVFLLVCLLSIFGLYIIKVTNNGSVCVKNTFIDEGSNIKLNYPCNWELKLNLKTQEIDAKGSYPELNLYQISFVNNSSVITLENFLYSVDTNPATKLGSNYDYTFVTDSLIRYKKSNYPFYSYGQKVDCNNFFAQTGKEEVCASTFFSNISKYPVLIEALEGNNPVKFLDELVKELIKESTQTL